EQRERRHQLERVDTRAQKRPDRDPAVQLIGHDFRDGEQPRPEFRVLEISGGLVHALQFVVLSVPRRAKAGQLGEHVPDPVVALAAGAEFVQRGVESGSWVPLRLHEPVETLPCHRSAALYLQLLRGPFTSNGSFTPGVSRMRCRRAKGLKPSPYGITETL